MVETIVRQMHPGWNLGNSLDATGSETSWGNPRSTREIIDVIAASGFKSIRIPVTWGHRMGPPPEHRIDPAFMARVQEVVDWALDAGLYVVLNMHHDTSQWIIHMPRERQAVLERFEAAWRQIAEHFRDYPHTLLLEGINEPRFSHDWGEDSPLFFQLADELQTAFHRIVRNSGGQNVTRPLLLTTITGSPSRPRTEALAESIRRLGDASVIATIHYYGYYPFSVNVAGGTRFDERAAADIRESFDRAYDMFAARGIPVVVGEFGLLGFDRSIETIQRGERLKFFEAVTAYAREKGLTMMLWDNGQHFDRRRLVWRDPVLLETIMATVSGRASQGETDQIFIKPGDVDKGVQTRLFLRGNRLVEAFAGERRLVEGIDYEMAGETVTFSGRLVMELLAAKDAVESGAGANPGSEAAPKVAVPEPGTQVTTTWRFSHGPDWSIDLIVYDRPILEKSVGTTSSFFIPAQFRGDRLATMEAVYAASGRPAGPAGWTSFKEFGLAFWPEYSQNKICLTREFFNEVEDGEILLTFHFWSGEKVTYLLDKSGAQVRGSH